MEDEPKTPPFIVAAYSNPKTGDIDLRGPYWNNLDGITQACDDTSGTQISYIGKGYTDIQATANAIKKVITADSNPPNH
jgi:hypothetical protein